MKNTLKNITIVALLAWLSFFLLGGGEATELSTTQLGMPVFIMVLGTLIAVCSHKTK